MLTEYQQIPLNKLAPSPTNPRKHFDPESLREMAETIVQHGVIEPIIVRPWPDEYDAPADYHDARPAYEIIAGARRYHASKLAEVETIPALIRDLDTRQVLEIQIIENLQRRGVNELEEAEGYQLMMRDYGYTADDLAVKVGKSRAYIYGRLKLCDLAEAPREAFRQGKIRASVALLIARVPTPALQEEATEDVTDAGLSARDAAAYIQRRYMLHLDRASWPLEATWPDDLTLAHLPACTVCPKNTSSNRDLYADMSTDVCTDAECWRTKRLGYLEVQARELRAVGHAVIAGEDARKLAPGGLSGYIANGWLRTDAHGHWRGKHQTPRQAFGEVLDATPRTWIEDVITGKLVECVPREALWALNEEAKRADSEAEQAALPEERKAEIRAEEEARKIHNAACEAENAFRAALWARICDRVSMRNGVPTPALRAVVRYLADDGGWLDPDTAAEHFPGVDYDDDDFLPHVHAQLDQMTPAAIFCALIDLIVGTPGMVHPLHPADYLETPRYLTEMAQAYGLNPEAIRAEMAPEPDPAPTPPEAAPAPDSPAPKPKTRAKKAAPAGDQTAEEPQKQGADAAEKTPAKGKNSGRASPARGKKKTAEMSEGAEA